MEEDWTGKAVSIECDAKLGVFQGIIKDISEWQITIVRAFRNGVPLRKQDAEVTLRSTDILNISLIPSYNGQSTVTPSVINKPTPVKQPNFANAGIGAAAGAAAGGGAMQQLQQQHQLWNGTPKDKNSTSALTNKMSNMKMSSNGCKSTPVSSRAPTVQQPQPQPGCSYNGGSNKSSPPLPCNNSVAQFFGNMIPPKVEVRMGAAFANCPTMSATGSAATSFNAESYGSSNGGGGDGGVAGVAGCSKPIDIVNTRGSYYGQHNSNVGAVHSNGNGNGKPRNGNGNGNCGSGSVSGNGGGGGGVNGSSRKQRKQLRRENSIKQNQTFGTSVDDPLLHEDFDFEGNLALFNKQAIWDVIESEQKPDLVRQAAASMKKKYRHDENILVSEPLQLRQIESVFDGSTDFVTDEGLIIPTIPTFVRSKIEMTAEKEGLSLQRQIDILARGATDLAILLLGGARRLTPNNCHQWPKIAIICEKSNNFRASNIGASTGRQLASHGLKVLLYLEEDATIEQKSNEISLFKASGNPIVYSVNALPTPDLVILSTNTVNLSNDVKKWLSENRASVLAIDPPPSGINDVSIKYAILPILPLNGISSNNCGKLYLCNLGIPDKFYRDAGIKYKSPFGHKFVIPIHSKD